MKPAQSLQSLSSSPSLQSPRPLQSIHTWRFMQSGLSKIPRSSLEPSRLRATLIATLLCLSVSLTFLSGCLKPPVEPAAPEPVLDPTLVHSAVISGWAWTNDPSQAISPDGRYLLLAQHDDDATQLIAYPLPDGDQSAKQNHSQTEEQPIAQPIVLRKVDRRWAIENGLEFIPVGWLSGTECLFVSSGLQNEGKHRNRQGLSILTADISGKHVRELAFISLDYAIVRNAALDAENHRLILDAAESIFSVDLESCEVKIVKQNPPTYQGSLAAELSPDKNAYVYNLYEDGKHGVYLLNLDTGTEAALLPSGESTGFYPAWSPNGEYVAAYTVARKPGASMASDTGFSLDDYQFYLGEDSPMPFGTGITIVDRSGQPASEITVAGRVLGHFKWSADSKYIGFVSCAKPAQPQPQSGSAPDESTQNESQGDYPGGGSSTGDGLPGYADGTEGNWEIPVLRADSMWIADVATGATTKVADLSSISGRETVSIYPVAFSSDSKGLLYQVIQEQSSSIWYGANPAQIQPGQITPAKVTDGLWYGTAIPPVFDTELIAITGETEQPVGQDAGNAGSGSTWVNLWLMGNKGFREVGRWRAITGTILACDEETLIIYSYLGNEQFQVTIYSMYKVPE